jgi:UDP-glucose 4-epimerase
MKVLLTGATTPLGYAVLHRLQAVGAEHVLCVAADAGGCDAPRISYRRIDLTRDRAVHDLVHGEARATGIDVVIHLAQHRDARDEGARVHAENVESTRQLLRACTEVPSIRRFVYPSSAAVYALRAAQPTLLDEDAPLDFDPAAAQWVRDRVEADLTVCARMGMAPLQICVLRLAEVLAAGVGSQLWDYLRSRVCLRPLGFDPMLNVLSLDDAASAIVLAATRSGQGVYNIAGADTLPLSRLIACAGRRNIPVPGPLLDPLYRLRTRVLDLEFRYDLNFRRFHFGGIIDDTRARRELGFRPIHPI